jgi:aminopeptidase N
VHETAHMWFPMQVGSDERRFAWQDEGLTRFNQAQGMQAYFKGYDRERIARDSYLSMARTDGEVPLMRHGDLYPVGTAAYGVATYDKMATNMVALRGLIGNESFQSAYRTYGSRWIGKHPTQYDFFNNFNSLLRQDLNWFWRTWWYETWTLDQAIGSVTTASDTLKVTIEDRGLAMMPVRLAITRTGGRVERQVVPVSVWLAGARRHVVTLTQAAGVVSIEIDPEMVFPDIDRGNNRWSRGGK